MIRIGFLLLTTAVVLSACKDEKQEKEENEETKTIATENLYLGQKPPGLKPELFAPGMVSTEDNLEIEGVFAPGMQEFYFTRQVNGERPKLHTIKNIKGEWVESSEPRPNGEVFISPDGQTMHLANDYRTRTAAGWSSNKKLDSTLFGDYRIMRLTASEKGTFVFDERDTIGTIRYSHLVDGKRQAPQAYDSTINSGNWTAHPFIAPDESYIIWDSALPGGIGDSDLYISFKTEDGSWGPGINLGPVINSEYEDAYGSITPDGKFFMFHRIYISDESFEQSFADIYWVDASVVLGLKTQ